MSHESISQCMYQLRWNLLSVITSLSIAAAVKGTYEAITCKTVTPLTSICWIQWLEQYSKEGCGVFASIDNMWKCKSSVTVAAQTLCKTKPCRQAWDQRTHTICNTATQWRPYTEHSLHTSYHCISKAYCCCMMTISSQGQLSLSSLRG